MSAFDDRSPLRGEDLDRLEIFLSSDRVSSDCMLLDEVDGLLAAVACTPDSIMPSEWMPVVWGGDEPKFESLREAEEIVGALMRLFNNSVRVIDYGDGYRPMLSRVNDDDGDGETHAEWWASGFIEGMKLRGQLWFESDDSALVTLVSSIFVLAKIDPPDLEISGEFVADGEPLHNVITRLVYTIRDYWRGTWPTGGKRREYAVWSADPGDACPCGSGKKFKDCCGRSSPTVH
jgi:uncharacterized protein